MNRFIKILTILFCCVCFLGANQADHTQAIVQVWASNGSGGTGTLVSPEGHILTCKHVVAGSTNATASFRNGYKSKGNVIGMGQTYDTAIFKIDPPKDVQYIPIAENSAPQNVEVEVFGYGCQYGVSIDSINLYRWKSKVHGYKTLGNESLIKLDAHAYSGDSGGPIIYNGEVVGIVSGGELQYRNGPPIDSHGPYNGPIRNLLKTLAPHLFEAQCGPQGCINPYNPGIRVPQQRIIPDSAREIVPNTPIQKPIENPIQKPIEPIQPQNCPGINKLQQTCDEIKKAIQDAAIEDGKRQVQINKLIEDQKKLNEQIVGIEKKVETIEKMPGPRGDQGQRGETGPQGKPGNDGLDGKDAVVDMVAIEKIIDTKVKEAVSNIPPPQPPISTISHLVLVASSNAEYWYRLKNEFDRAQDYYANLVHAEPPTNKDVGELPAIVSYKDGKPVNMITGLRKVEDVLSSIVRGDYNTTK